MKLTIAEWRRLKNISQEDMATSCGVHVNTWRYWEANPGCIKVTNAEVIAEKLGVSLLDIIFTSD